MAAKVPYLILSTKTQGVIMEQTSPIDIWLFLAALSFWLFIYYSELIRELLHATKVI